MVYISRISRRSNNKGDGGCFGQPASSWLVVSNSSLVLGPAPFDLSSAITNTYRHIDNIASGLRALTYSRAHTYSHTHASSRSSSACLRSSPNESELAPNIPVATLHHIWICNNSEVGDDRQLLHLSVVVCVCCCWPHNNRQYFYSPVQFSIAIFSSSFHRLCVF